MRAFYFILPVLLLSIRTGAQLNIQDLVHLVDCHNYSCISTAAQPKGYAFADSTFDEDFKTSQYIFQHKPLISVSAPINTLTLSFDGIAGLAVINFETVGEDIYRKLLNDIKANGFELHQALGSGDIIYSYPNTRLVIFVGTDTYEDGLHYVFTINYKPDNGNNSTE